MRLAGFVYFLLLALSAGAAYLLNDRIGYTPLLFLLLLLPLDALCVFYLRRRVRPCGTPGRRRLSRGTAAALPYAYENRGGLLACRLRVVLRLTGPEGSQPRRGKAELSIAPNGKAAVEFSLTPRHIGVYRAQIRRAKVRGPLGLFRRRLPAGQPGFLVVTPSRRTIALPESAAGGRGRGSAAAAYGGQSADSYSGAREYEPGDPMRSIHWKLTAHSQKMMTRLYEYDEDAYATVAVDLRPGEGTPEQRLDTRDRLCETAYAALCTLAGQGGKTRLVFAEGDRLRSVPVRSESDLPEAAAALASADPALAPLTDAQGIFSNTGPLVAVSARLDTELAERLGERRGEGRAMFFFIAPPLSAGEEAGGYFDYLKAHEVAFAVEKAAPSKRQRRGRLDHRRV